MAIGQVGAGTPKALPAPTQVAEKTQQTVTEPEDSWKETAVSATGGVALGAAAGYGGLVAGATLGIEYGIGIAATLPPVLNVIVGITTGVAYGALGATAGGALAATAGVLLGAWAGRKLYRALSKPKAPEAAAA